VLLESELERLGMVDKNSHAYPPADVRRRGALPSDPPALSRQQPPRCITGRTPALTRHVPRLLQPQPPHRALTGQTPLIALTLASRLVPKHPVRAPSHLRDTVVKAGRVTLRYLSRLRHIGVGRRYVGARITLLVAGTYCRVVDEGGRLSLELTSIPLATTSHSVPRAVRSLESSTMS
jgi:hypothetical protein